MFLSDDELQELTGYVISTYQQRWLDRAGYPYETTAAGRVKVLKAYVEKRLGVAASVVAHQTKPDFSRWKR